MPVLPRRMAFHQLVEGHEIDGGAHDPLAPAPDALDRHDEMRQPAQAQKHVADVELAVHGLAEPQGVGIVGFAQAEGPRIGDLHPAARHHADVHEDPAVAALEALQHPFEQGLVRQPVAAQDIGHHLDLGQLLAQEPVHALAVLEHQLLHMGQDLSPVGLVELVAADDGQAQQRRARDTSTMMAIMVRLSDW